MPRCFWTISPNPNSNKCFYSVYDVCILNLQFVCPNGFYSVYRRIYFPNSVHVLQVPTVFIPFTTRCILDAQFVGPNGFYSVYRRICFPSGTSCHSFAFRQSSREFTLVRLYLNVKQVEDSENRYGVFIGFCLKPPCSTPQYSRLIQQPKLRIPPSPY